MKKTVLGRLNMKNGVKNIKNHHNVKQFRKNMIRNEIKHHNVKQIIGEEALHIVLKRNNNE